MNNTTGGDRSTRQPPFPFPTDRPSRALERRVLAAISDRALLHDVHHALISVSGGPDSTALLLLLARLQPRLGLALTVAHVDHGLRPAPQRRADAAFVTALCAALDIPLLTRKTSARSRAEEALRNARYTALRDATTSAGCDAIALGHTSDDQAETVLFRLARGSGLPGLAGIRPRSPWPFPSDGPDLIRPLLTLRRSDIEAYLRAADVQPRLDPTNTDRRYARNRIRADVIPTLTTISPRAVEAITRAAAAAEEALSLLRAEADRAWPAVVHQENNAVTLRGPALAALHPAVRNVLIAHAIALLRPEDTAATEAIARVDDLLAGPRGRRADLGGALRAIRVTEGVRLSLHRRLDTL